MSRIAFLSMRDINAFVNDDQLCFNPLAKRGWQVEEIPWEAPPKSWAAFDRVIIRSPWNYQDHPQAFLKVLASIEAEKIPLFNSLDLVRWNLEKTYLKDLSEKGVAIVPTVWRKKSELAGIEQFYHHFSCHELILKPVVGANSDHAHRFKKAEIPAKMAQLRESFSTRDFMIQPFLDRVLSEGEYSLFYFNGNYSHAIVKIPRRGDFRVQEEFGGLICAHNPSPSLQTAAAKVMAALPEMPLYARVDLVMDEGGLYRLMELELIEPSLYLRMHPDAGENFARAILT